MRKLKKGRKFGRKTDQRRALMKSLASSFFVLGKIKTTEAKAKELRPQLERLITRGKNPILANRRILRMTFSVETVRKIIEYGALFTDRAGGYTRITKIAPRAGDAARMAIIELVR